MLKHWYLKNILFLNSRNIFLLYLHLMLNSTGDCLFLHDRNWSVWALSLLWHLKEFGYLPFNKTAWRQCLCSEKLYYLARNMLSYTAYWSNISRFILGKVPDNCCFLNYLLSCKFPLAKYTCTSWNSCWERYQIVVSHTHLNGLHITPSVPIYKVY